MKARITLLILLATGLLSQVNASILTVTNTLDSGAGSFRQTIADAGSTAGPDTVMFQIPQADAGYQAAEGIWVIQPITLFILDDDSMFVDGTSQAEFIGSDTNPLGPEIVIDGSIGTSEVGISLDAQSIQIRHLVVHGYESVSISVSDNNCLVAGCYVGTDHTGAHKVTPESNTGIHISFGDDNIIGGASAADRNIISGNRVNGIDINRSKGNQILNNVIGLNATGSDTLGNNTGINIFISTMNTIGPGNIISGNTYHGITLASDETDSNLVIGNYIGTDFLGSSAMPNQTNGINLHHGDYNIIGGNTAETRNVISGNGSAGILIYEAGYNEVYGNYIGTDQTGMAALPNGGPGVQINASQYNQIGLNEAGYGNLISGNSRSGLQLISETSEGNICAGNLIGTDITGANGLPNEYEGVRIYSGAHDNTIGPGNIIAFSLSEGINMWGSTTLRNTITQNSFHSNTEKAINVEEANLELEPPVLTAIASVTGTATPNATVEIFSTPDDEALTYEGTVIADGDGNFYWPGSPAGPYVTATATDLEGNTSELSTPRFAGLPTVTTTADTGLGSLRWAIDIANSNSGPDTITFNISDADPGYDGAVWTILPLSELPMVTDSGTVIDGRTQTQNQGNTNPDGPEIMLNGQSAGEYAKGIKFNSPYNVLTGFVVSGFDDEGVYIASTGGHHNHVFGNYIGTSANGQEALPNDYGVSVGYNAVLNTIGGSSEDEMNLISGNIAFALYLNGSSESLIVGNRIGTTRDGLAPLPNGQSGIYMADSWENRIGGSDTGEGNLISGNGHAGIDMNFGQSSHNLVQGNYIGTDITGEALIPNSWDGVRIQNGANINRIGGESAGEGNVICGNRQGVQIEDADSDGNQIIGNFIGTDQTGTLRLPNEASGIYIENGAQSSQIGPGNIIRSNMWAGVDVIGETTLYHTITANSIFEHEGGGIRIRYGGNENLAAPEITGSNPVTGTAPSNSRVEIFSDSTDQGRIYEGFTTADVSGNFTYTGVLTGPRVTATATDRDGNTSPFSSPALIGELIVTHTGDEGDNSLRWAITLANEVLGPDTINFDIPEADANFDGTAWWINPLTALPAISDSGTIIRGFSQTDLHGETNPAGPEIVISGQGRNISYGIEIDAGGCEVNGLVIGGFTIYGIAIRGEDDNIIRGNYIGTDPAGSDTLPNYSGIYCQGKRNRIGGINEADKNLISGNEWQGIFLEFGSENLFIGNYIGTDRTGSVALPNREGIQLGRQSLNNTIGGTTPEERNIISGNERNGIYIQYASTRYNHIIGNYIGTDTSGTHAVSNGWRGVFISREASHNTIGGPNAEQGNLISGNLQPGIYLSSVGTDSNIIQSNFIGTDVNGTSALGNDDGVYIAYGASNNQVIENVISGNEDTGIYIRRTATDSNIVRDNIIGLNVTGMQALPNYLGIKISQNAQRNLVHSNIISGNMFEGISIYGDSTWHNIISANWIGLNATGQDTLPNGGTGIYVANGADSTIIGGSSEEDGNMISGSGSSGIYITSDTTDAALIAYNWIGTDINGTKDLGNANDGISINGMNHHIEYNLISGNNGSGVTLREPSQGIRIQRNLIGVQADSISPLPNIDSGIRIEEQSILNIIGPANRIWHNGNYAIEIQDSTDQQITITENSITQNVNGGINLMYGANKAILAPAVLNQSPLIGLAPPNCRIEIFSDSSDQGRLYLGWTQSDESGAWLWTGSLVKPNITATATDANGNTSEFSNSLMVSVDENELAAIPETYYLTQNYPNPFNPTTTIEFGIPKEGHVTLKVYDLLGREAISLVDEKKTAGNHEVSFDASALASGLYFYRISTEQFTKIRKMVLVK